MDNPSQDKTREEWDEYYSSYIQEKGLPQMLYKFRYWHCGHQSGISAENCPRCQHQRQILTGPTIWFATSDSFNDPFDCKIPFRWDLQPREELRARLMTLARQWGPTLTDDEINSKVDRTLQDNDVFSSDDAVRSSAWDRYSQMIADSYGIFSLAGVNDHTLLWSHYSDSHKGFCVELDAHSLARQLFDLSRTDKQFIDLHKIEYAEELPKVLPSNDEDTDWDRHISLLKTKSSVWEYEDEWRFFWLQRTALPKYIEKETIRRVIIGCQMPLQHRNELIANVETHLPSTEIWEATRSHTEFKLQFSRVSR